MPAQCTNGAAGKVAEGERAPVFRTKAHDECLTNNNNSSSRLGAARGVQWPRLVSPKPNTGVSMPPWSSPALYTAIYSACCVLVFGPLQRGAACFIHMFVRLSSVSVSPPTMMKGPHFHFSSLLARESERTGMAWWPSAAPLFIYRLNGSRVTGERARVSETFSPPRYRPVVFYDEILPYVWDILMWKALFWYPFRIGHKPTPVDGKCFVI